MTGWDERFRKGEHTGRAPAGALAKLAASSPKGRALDLACGAGRHSTLLAQHGWNVIAVDASAEALRRIAKNERISVVLADLAKGEFAIDPKAYDLIVCWHYWQANLLEPMAKGLRQGGVLAMAARVEGRFAADVALMDATVAGWEVLHRHRRDETIELIARKPAAI